MIQTITLILLAAISIYLAYQDLKHREISIWSLGVFFGINMVWLLSEYSIWLVLDYAWKNLLIVAVLMGFITLFYSIKNKKITNIFDTVFGLGDLVFLAVLLPSMSPFNFLVFITVSNALILLGFMVYLILAKKNTTSIPYAGVLSLLYYTYVLQGLWTG